MKGIEVFFGFISKYLWPTAPYFFPWGVLKGRVYVRKPCTTMT
jgi:hypothetical protein